MLFSSDSIDGRLLTVAVDCFVVPTGHGTVHSLKWCQDVQFRCPTILRRTFSCCHSRDSSLQGHPAGNDMDDGGYSHPPDFDDDFGDDLDDEFYQETSTSQSALHSSSSSVSDWMEAELTLLRATAAATTDPVAGPHPDLTAEQVAVLCMRSLQFVDHPTPNAGLQRCYPFFTPECRKLVTARQGGQSVERFCQYGMLSPALQPFMGAVRIDLDWDRSTVTPAQPPHRGALASVPVEIHGATVLAEWHGSGMERRRNDGDGNSAMGQPPITHMVMRLEQQRRPPYQGCWMIREILDVRHAFAGDMGNAHVGG